MRHELSYAYDKSCASITINVSDVTAAESMAWVQNLGVFAQQVQDRLTAPPTPTPDNVHPIKPSGG